MRIGPTNPFHIARAYQTQPPKAAPAPQQPDAAPVVGSIKPPSPTSRIVAAQVPGRVNFSGAQPQPEAAALAFYRHPADKNAAATAINAGKTLDVQG
jgi:hypothetical protein